MTTQTLRTVAGSAAGELFHAFGELARIVGDTASAFAAGLRASHEWKRLNAMSNAELARRGLSREGIGRAVMERHFR